MSDSVRIVFLGGLGEIGRNCCCIEVDERILLVDCGIMFPDADMPGVDLVLPDFTYLRENADRVEAILLTHAHEDHAGGIAFLLARRLRTGLRVGPLARAGAQPHRGSGHARPHRADPGGRRRAPPHRSDRLPVHPGDPLGAAGLRDRVLHARRHDHPQRRLQARPHAGRRPAHQPRDARRHREPRRRRPAAHVGLHQRRAARASRRRSRRWARRCVRCSASIPTSGSSSRASPRTCTACSRSRRPRSPTAARSRSSAGRCNRTSRWRTSAASSTFPTQP